MNRIARLFRVPLLIALAMALAGVPAGCASLADRLASMDVVAENEFLCLHLDPQTTEIAVYDKEADAVWWSNPVDRTAKEKILRGKAANRLSSQFTISGFTPEDHSFSMDNYSDSVQHGQYEVTPIPLGVRIDYTLGLEYRNEDRLPQMIGKQRFEDLILDKVSEDDRKTLLDAYDLISLEPVRYKPIETSDFDVRALLGDYEVVSHGEEYRELEAEFLDLDKQVAALEESGASESDLRQLRNSLERTKRKFDTLRKQLLFNLVYKVRDYRKDVDTTSGVKREHISQVFENQVYFLNKIPTFVADDIRTILKNVGYTAEDVQRDHIENNLDPPEPNPIVYRVSVEYRLDGDSLVVEVPVSEIEYPIGVVYDGKRRGDFRITSISLLEFFGAADAQQQGYILVPDGCGALIHLNNGKLYAEAFGIEVYGSDRSIPREEEITLRNQAYLPVFGMRQGDRAFFAVIEEGDALSRIRADVAGRTSSFNTVYAEFNTNPRGFTYLSAAKGTKINIYQSRPYQGRIRIRYAFLYGDDSDYAGMARHYHDYLVKTYGMERLKPRDNIPFYLEIIGAISANRQIMGIPRTVVEPVTTFEQAKAIVEAVAARGVDNIKLRYMGWLEGGLNHRFPTGVYPEPRLGGLRQLSGLRDYMLEHGYDLYLDVGFLNVARGARGFNARSDASRYLNRPVAKVYDYDWATYQLDRQSFRYVLSPSKLEAISQRYVEDHLRHGFSALSLSYEGSQINSDFRPSPTDTIDRQQSAALLWSALRQMAVDQGLKLMVSGGNAVVLPYVTDIVGIPLDDSYFGITDERVPFYQIAVHGLVEYAGPPANLADDYLESILRSVETGAAIYFAWIYADSSVVKGTPFSYLYGLNYLDWLERAVDAYSAANEVLRDLQDSRIVGHSKLAEGVYQTIYEGGAAIVVNYTDEPFTVDRHQVESKGFIVLREAIAR